MKHDEKIAFEEANPDIIEQERADDFNSRVDLFVNEWYDAGAYITYDQPHTMTIHYGKARLTERHVQDAFRRAIEKHNYRGKYPEKWRGLVSDRLAAKLTNVAGEIFMPNGPKFVCETVGVYYINVWRPFLVVPTLLEDGTEPDLDLFFELVERLIPNEEQREYFYDWLADIVQHPERRKPVGLYFVSEEGTGKGRFFEWIVKKLLVQQCIETSDLPVSNSFGFTGYDRCLLAIFDDFGKVSATTTRKMKSCLSENEIRINEKNIAPRTAPAYFRAIVYTNEVGAYPLSAGDRRWTVFSYVDHKISKEETLEFMTRFRKELERCGEKPQDPTAPGAAYVSAVYNWLMAREYDEDRLYLPLETEFGNQIKGAKTEDEQSLEDLLESYDAVTVQYIKYTFSLPQRENDIADMLQAFGWHKQVNGVDQLGKRCRVWYRPEAFRDGHSAKHLRGRVNVPRTDDGAELDEVDNPSTEIVVDQPSTLPSETPVPTPETPKLTDCEAPDFEPPEDLAAAFENDAPDANAEDKSYMTYLPDEYMSEDFRSRLTPPKNVTQGFWMYVDGVKVWYDPTTGSESQLGCSIEHPLYCGEKPVELIPDDQLPACMCAPRDDLPPARGLSVDAANSPDYLVWSAVDDCWQRREPLSLH